MSASTLSFGDKSAAEEWTASFVSVWPGVAAYLRASLRRRGTDRQTTEDALQETAARALALQVPFDSAEDLLKWARRVANNLLIDWHRRQAKIAETIVPERAEPADVSAVVEHRLALEAVGHHLRSMSKADQAAIGSLIDGRRPTNAAEANRWYVYRNRLRPKLQEMLDGLAAMAFGIRRRLGVASSHPAAPSCLIVAQGLVAAVLLTTGHSLPPVSSTVAASAMTSPAIGASAARPAVPTATTAVAIASRSRAGDGRSTRADTTGTSVVVRSPVSSHRIDTEIFKGPPDAPLLCLGNVPLLGTNCVERPPVPE